MKIIRIFKLFFLLSISLLVLSLQSSAEIQYSNILSKIVIDEAEAQNYNINLIFDKKFDGNAFIQKRQNGSYYVFVPDTAAEAKNIKIIYRDGKDKSNIKIKLEESVYQKDDTDTAYVKLDVDITGNYSIQLYSKTVDEYNLDPVKFNFNWGKTICGIILLLAFIILLKLISVSRNNTKGMPHIISPYPILKTDLPSNLISAAERSVLEKKYDADNFSTKQNIKMSDRTFKDTFSCFDIPSTEENKNDYQDIEINSKIKQPAINLYEKTLKSKITNPITKADNEASEFSMPVVEDIVPVQKEQKEVKKDYPELLSELRITPTKGFYLTTIDNTFALFGFVGQNVFLLNKFSDLSQINLQARFYDRQKNSDLYIVRLDSYKAMVEISDTGMKELAVL
jgi:hypothetical protein